MRVLIDENWDSRRFKKIIEIAYKKQKTTECSFCQLKAQLQKNVFFFNVKHNTYTEESSVLENPFASFPISTLFCPRGWERRFCPKAQGPRFGWTPLTGASEEVRWGGASGQGTYFPDSLLQGYFWLSVPQQKVTAVLQGSLQGPFPQDLVPAPSRGLSGPEGGRPTWQPCQRFPFVSGVHSFDNRPYEYALLEPF